MGMKRIILKNTKCCPNCGGTKGLYLHQPAKLRRRNQWGTSYKSFTDDKIIVPKQKYNKSAVCEECEQRFVLIKKDT